MGKTKYKNSLLRHWQTLAQLSDSFMDHQDVHHSQEYISTGDADMLNTQNGRSVAVGGALVESLVNREYLLRISLVAFWDLFKSTKNLKNEKLLSFVTRSFLEIFERRLCYLAYSNNSMTRVKSYLFTSAHLWYDELELSRLLVEELIRLDPNLRAKSDELLVLARNGKKRDIMKRLSFDDRSHIRTNGFIAEAQLSNSEDIYAVYSLAIHGDPITGVALAQQQTDKFHFLLPKTLQIMIACEVTFLMVDTLSKDDCEYCFHISKKLKSKIERIKNFSLTNIAVISPSN